MNYKKFLKIFAMRIYAIGRETPFRLNKYMYLENTEETDDIIALRVIIISKYLCHLCHQCSIRTPDICGHLISR
jgi:hypothetical protein